MARKRSPEGRILAYFSFEPLDEAKKLLLMVHEIMRERLGIVPEPKRVVTRRRKVKIITPLDAEDLGDPGAPSSIRR